MSQNSIFDLAYQEGSIPPFIQRVMAHGADLAGSASGDLAR